MKVTQEKPEQWIEHGGALSFKWNERHPGEAFVGTWLGTHPGGTYEDRKLVRGRLDVGDEVLTFDVPKALQRDVADLPVGGRVKLVYQGMDKSAAGRSFHKFQVFKPKGAARATRPPASAAPDDDAPPRGDHEAPDDEVPF
jgi:hypothetical protein